MIPQHGGKYADHEFVKVASKVIKGVERAPYTKFETILVNYDKMKEIKGKRNLTKSEQRIYDKADKLIQKEFDAMFKKADTMLDQLDRKIPAQKGGGEEVPAEVDTKEGGTTPPYKEPGAASDASQENPVNGPATNAASTLAASPPTSSAPTNADAEVPADTEEVPPATKELPPPAAPAAAGAPAPAAPATDEGEEGEEGKEGNKTRYMDSNRPYRWIVSLLKGLWDWIKGLFTGAFSEKFEGLKKQFSADELFKLFGPNPEKIQEFTGEFKEHAEKLQRLVASGIGGAASASIDMILNAFSMSPVFGTTILVWRMFQNMLMIMGASLSVQAADSTFSTSAAKAANPEEAKKAGQRGGNAKAKNNVTKRIKADIRQLNRSLKRYMHFTHKQQGPKGMKSTTMSGSGAGSGYSYT